MAPDKFKSLLAVNLLCCLACTSLFVLHTFFATIQLYGNYATELSIAFLVVILLCAIVATVFSLLAFVVFVSSCRQRRWTNRRGALRAFAATVIPFPAMVLTIQVVAGVSKWWIMNS